MYRYDHARCWRLRRSTIRVVQTTRASPQRTSSTSASSRTSAASVDGDDIELRPTVVEERKSLDQQLQEQSRAAAAATAAKRAVSTKAAAPAASSHHLGFSTEHGSFFDSLGALLTPKLHDPSRSKAERSIVHNSPDPPGRSLSLTTEPDARASTMISA